MGLKDLNIGKRKFDTNEKPWVLPWYLYIPFRIATLGFKYKYHTKVRKHNFEGTKPPYFILQNHAAFVDFSLTLQAMFPHRIGWVTAIDEFVYREWITRTIGCMYKRKFTPDIKVVQHIFTYLRKYKKSVCIFPEARYSLIGINEEPDFHSYARLIKMAKLPVVLGMSKGNFIHGPQWNKTAFNKIPIQSDFTVIFKPEEIEKLSTEEIENKLTELFVYDDFKYWQESGVKVKTKTRAEGIHRVLYKCPHCGKEFEMDSKGSDFWCNACGHKWTLTENGFIEGVNGETYFKHAPDWYRWEREEVRKEVEAGTYNFKCPARINWLKCTHDGYIPYADGTFTHDENGLTFTGKKLEDGTDFTINRPVPTMYSCHIEYDYFGKGDTIDIATSEDSYYIFPSLQNRITKIHFGTEELYKKWKHENDLKKQENK